MTKTLGQTLADFNPIGRLTITCHYPSEQTLIFHQQGGGRFRLSTAPDCRYSLKGLQVRPEIPGLDRFVSDGAIAGAGAAAVLGWDTMEGAIIGDWLEKQSNPQSQKSHRLDLLLEDVESGAEEQFQFSLSADDCKRVYKYFR